MLLSRPVVAPEPRDPDRRAGERPDDARLEVDRRDVDRPEVERPDDARLEAERLAPERWEVERLEVERGAGPRPDVEPRPPRALAERLRELEPLRELAERPDERELVRRDPLRALLRLDPLFFPDEPPPPLLRVVRLRSAISRPPVGRFCARANYLTPGRARGERFRPASGRPLTSPS